MKTMDYEKAYKDALERGKLFLCGVSPSQHTKDIIEKIFPELAESEDEKIRRELMQLVYCVERGATYTPNKGTIEKFYDWLERQKPAEWSEGDERMLNEIITKLKRLAVKDPNDMPCFLEDRINWLKSLKPQNRWKPSEEQIQALEYQVHSTYKGSWQYKASKELLEQLKKL